MARKERKDLDTLLQEEPKLQEQFQERVEAILAEARAVWEEEWNGQLEESEPEEAEAPEESVRLAEEWRALEEAKAAFARQQMELAVGQALRELGLPTAFAPWLAGETGEESAQRVDRFETLFREEVAKAVMSRMRGADTPRAPQASKGYSREELRNLTHQEINANWTAVQQALEARG